MPAAGGTLAGPPPGKAIALVEWYWGGHHPTYFAHFVLALEQLGVRVLGLCPQPEDARRIVAELRGAVPWVSGGAGIEFDQVPAVSRGRWLPSRLYAAKQAIKRFHSVERVVRRWQGRTCVPECEIFYACMYEWDFDYFKYAVPFLTLPWSGLYIRPTTMRNGAAILEQRRVSPQVDRISRDRRLKSLAILDEGIRPAFAERLGRRVVVFPDFTDERILASHAQCPLAERLRTFAAGRPLVGIFGHLQRSKGLTTLCGAARKPALAGLCFAIVGEVDWLDFAPDERRQLQEWFADAANVWTHLARVPGEPQLNALISSYRGERRVSHG
jgi:hypothetical protein